MRGNHPSENRQRKQNFCQPVRLVVPAMSWSALLLTVFIAIALAAAIICSVENWTRWEPTLAKWGWLGTLILAVPYLWIVFDGWGRGETTRTVVFGIGTILLLTLALVDYRRTHRPSGK